MVLEHRMHSTFSVLALLLGVLNTSCASAPGSSFATEKSQPYSQAIFELSELATVAYNDNRWAEAARHYEQLTNDVPNDAYVWFRLANAYVQQGQYDQAVDAYENSIVWDSSQPKPWFNLSTTYLLNAKSAMRQSWEYLRETDPARNLIELRIKALDELMNVPITENVQ